jgi:hypothetical protein
MALCAERGRFLYEVRPDVFAEGRLTDTEIAMWAKWYAEREQRQQTK